MARYIICRGKFMSLSNLEQLQETDRIALELAKSRRLLVISQTEKALAQNETAELSYKYFILQLYMKYGLTDADGIDENGKILRNHVKAETGTEG
jgi:hypothetical protein